MLESTYLASSRPEVDALAGAFAGLGFLFLIGVALSVLMWILSFFAIIGVLRIWHWSYETAKYAKWMHSDIQQINSQLRLIGNEILEWRKRLPAPPENG